MYPLEEDLMYLHQLPQGHLRKFPLLLADWKQRNVYRCICKDKDITLTKVKHKKCILYIIEPRNKREKNPCILYFHGGAFVYRGWSNHFELCAVYAKETGSTVIYVEYRLAYNTKKGTTLKDCQAASDYVYSHTAELGIDENQIIIAGDSAGGYLALEVYEYRKKNALGLMLIYPAVDPSMRCASMTLYSDTPVWNSVFNQEMWEWYSKSAESFLDKDLSDYRNVYLETTEFDCLHDEGAALAEKISDITWHETKGTCHGYDIDLSLPTVKKNVERRIEFLNSILK